MEDVGSSRLDKWLASFPTSEIEREIAELKARMEQIQKEIELLQGEYGLVALAHTKAEQALMFQVHLRGIDESRDHALAASAAKAGQPRKRGKAAVLEIFEDLDPFTELRADDVREHMIARGWMDEDEDNHSIQVALSRLMREDELERVRYGVYRLRIPNEASTPTDVQSENGGGSEGRGDPVLYSGSPASTLEGAPDEAHRAGS